VRHQSVGDLLTNISSRTKGDSRVLKAESCIHSVSFLCARGSNLRQFIPIDPDDSSDIRIPRELISNGKSDHAFPGSTFTNQPHNFTW
jgi:hypothetical protein